jgi:hypothetical protein
LHSELQSTGRNGFGVKSTDDILVVFGVALNGAFGLVDVDCIVDTLEVGIVALGFTNALGSLTGN